MGILDEINNMKNQGIGEREILNTLQERGVTPRAIEDAFNQMRIKKAVSSESPYGEEGMEPSIMGTGLNPREMVSPTQLYVPKTQEINHNQDDFYSPNPPQFNEEAEIPRRGEYNQEEYIPQEGYESQAVGGYDTDTLIEVAEQVFSEKIKKEQKQIAALNEFATLAETRISSDHERIKKMEGIIDKLQAAILEKVGSYGRDLNSIKNEMGMMQESFEKMVPKSHEENSGNEEYIKELEKIAHEHRSEQAGHIHHAVKKTSKKK